MNELMARASPGFEEAVENKALVANTLMHGHNKYKYTQSSWI